MPSLGANDHNQVVRKINATLQGPVIDALAELVPEVRDLPRMRALETILDDLDLLDRCFMAFRANTDAFGELLVDRYQVPVEDAEAILQCGRSLDDVVAMVVRTAAKRYFRLRLDGVRSSSLKGLPRRKTRRKRGLFSRIRSLFGSQPARPGSSRQNRTRAELLYDAVKEYLLHDWQVPIIPEYCRMPPGLVRRLGPRLLDYRLAEDIRRLLADPDNPPPPTPVLEAEAPERDLPQAMPASEKRVSDGMAALDLSVKGKKDERARLEDILNPDQKRMKGNAFSAVMLDPKVRQHIPNADQMVRITAVLGSVNGMVAKMVVGDLGLKTDQLAVFLMSCHAALGDERFQMAFGVPERLEYVAKIVERAKAFQIGQETPLAVIADFVGKSFKAAEAATQAGRPAPQATPPL